MILDDSIFGSDADQTEQDMAAKGAIAPGLYLAEMVGCKDTIANSGSEGTEMTFRILAGPQVGKEVKDTLWKSDKIEANNRIKLHAHRLGLTAKVGGKYVRVEGKTAFADAIGVRVVVDVANRKYTDKNGQEKVGSCLAYVGVFSLDDPKAKAIVASAGVVTGLATSTPVIAKKKIDIMQL